MVALRTIHDGVQQPQLDIVSIPGLPDLIPQYRLKDHNRWLRDVLSKQITRARIMSFQYDFARPGAAVSWSNLLHEVTALLYGLAGKREDAVTRPIVFVCYSFGALILKKAILAAKERPEHRQIADCTAGIVFLGCLHDETHPALEDLWLRCAAVELRTTKNKNEAFETLKKSQDFKVVREVMESFRMLSSQFPVRSFFELRQTVFRDGRWTVNKSDFLCPEGASALGWDNEKLVPVDADHFHITEYPNRQDDFFNLLVDNLTELVNQTCPESNFPELDDAGMSHRGSEAWTHVLDHNASLQTLNLLDSNQISVALSVAGILQPTDGIKQQPNVPCVVTDPYQRNENFLGRQEVLETVHEALGPTTANNHKQRTFAICGLGGMGKTQIALGYIFEYLEDYQVILWADADSRVKLATSCARFLVRLGLRDEATLDPKNDRLELIECLNQLTVPWLFVFDNADGDDKEELLHDYWPGTDRGSVLITSRDVSLIGQYGGVELEELGESEAVDLLLRLSKVNHRRYDDTQKSRELDAAKQIVSRIGYLPLGIDHAARIIINDHCRMAEFVEAYNNQALISDYEDIQLVKRENTYRYSLRTVWDMNFQRLDSDQKKLIQILSFLDPDRIQLGLLIAAANMSADPELRFIDTAYKIHKCRTGLVRSSLVRHNQDLNELTIHRLVQASCQLKMSEAERKWSFKRAVNLLRQAWPVPPRTQIHNPSLWMTQQALLPHAQALCSSYVKSCGQDEPLIPHDVADWEFAGVLYESGWFCYEKGLLDSVADILNPAEEYCKRHIDQGGAKVLADVYGGLGSLCTESNQFQGAFDNFQKHWDYIKLAFERDELQRPSIYEVFGLGRLGNGYHGLQNYSEAEKYYRKCLDAWEGLPGDQKIFRTHLGTCLWLQGRLNEAEKVVVPIIKDREDITNFRTGMAIYALGNIQLAQADKLTQEDKKQESATKYQEAMINHTQTLKLWQKTLGKRHHKTADAFYKMGWHMHRSNDFKSAVGFLEQALDLYSDSPELLRNEIARTRYKLGCVFQDAGDRAAGKELIKEAERLRQAIVPPEHWKPATSEADYDEIVQFWTR